MTIGTPISPVQAKALTDALRPLVLLALDTAVPEDRKKFVRLVVDGEFKLHIATLITGGSLEIVVASIDMSDPDAEPKILAQFKADGGGLSATEEGVSFN